MIYRFLDFSFNTKTSELSKDEEITVLNAKPFTLLKLLVENPNQILDKDFPHRYGLARPHRFR